jgi:hypothetical protein
VQLLLKQQGKLRAIRDELHDMRAEAATDRSRVAGPDHALTVVQHRPLRTDERLAQLDDRVRRLEGERA